MEICKQVFIFLTMDCTLVSDLLILVNPFLPLSRCKQGIFLELMNEGYNAAEMVFLQGKTNTDRISIYLSIYLYIYIQILLRLGKKLHKEKVSIKPQSCRRSRLN